MLASALSRAVVRRSLADVGEWGRDANLEQRVGSSARRNPRKKLRQNARLYTLLQILSVTLFEKMRLQQAFPASEYIPPDAMPRNQLNLFTI